MGAAALPLAMIGSSAIGGLTAPEGQELQSFEGVSGADPRDAVSDFGGILADLFGASLDQVAEPVTLNTTFAPLPSYHGGGLPMPISAPAMDPNRLHPERKTIPGIQIPRRSLRSQGSHAGQYQQAGATDGSGYFDGYAPGYGPRGIMPGSGVSGAAPTVPRTQDQGSQQMTDGLQLDGPSQGVDEYAQVQAALDLLLQQQPQMGARGVMPPSGGGYRG